MQTAQINISKLYGIDGDATLDSFVFGTFRDDDVVEKRPAIIVVPGGGYGMVSRREAEPIAAFYMGKGYNAFILTYSVNPQAFYPAQLLQLAASVDYVRKHADELHVDTDKLYMVGFSAGGHLVANFSTDYFNINKKFGNDWDVKATAACLSYPVISAEYGHVASYENLLADRTEAERNKVTVELSFDKNVTDKTLPAFVWTTFEDNCVPPLNSLKYAEACIKHGVVCELHMFPYGWHGMSTCDALTNDEQPFMARPHAWLEMSWQFFQGLKK